MGGDTGALVGSRFLRRTRPHYGQIVGMIGADPPPRGLAQASREVRFLACPPLKFCRHRSILKVHHTHGGPINMDHTATNCDACKLVQSKLRCDCGDAERGHSPDCSYVRGLDAIQEEHDDNIYSQEEEPTTMSRSTITRGESGLIDD